MITETLTHLLLAADALHGAAAFLAGLLAWAMALAFGADGPGPAPAFAALVALAAPPADLPAAPVPAPRLATAETIRRDELRFVEAFTGLAAELRSGAAPARRLEDLRDLVPVLLGYARERGADPAELARLHARYWGVVGTATRAVKRRR